MGYPVSGPVTARLPGRLIFHSVKITAKTARRKGEKGEKKKISEYIMNGSPAGPEIEYEI